MLEAQNAHREDRGSVGQDERRDFLVDGIAQVTELPVAVLRTCGCCQRDALHLLRVLGVLFRKAAGNEVTRGT